MEVIQSIELISTDPNVRGGRSYIAGTLAALDEVMAALGFGGWRADG